MRSALVVGVVMFGVAGSGLFKRAEVPPPPLDAPLPTAKPYGLAKPPFGTVSSTSCAAASCHGGGKLDTPRSEYSTWAATAFTNRKLYDPHSTAYRVLFNDDSVRIGKLLGIKEPHKEALCLKCHSTEGVKPEEAMSEGVGCTACHGPADKWLDVHMLPEWKTLSNETKYTDYGFVPGKNLVARMTNCVTCHVGDADREVNHDLIAAGHPRLAFEYTRFQFNPTYRHHWDEVMPQPDFEVRAWTVGQAVTLRAATDLLRVRAERAAAGDTKTPWPEFSGLSCYACHQSVTGGDVGRDAAHPRRPAGVPGWELWSNAAAGVAAELCPDAFPGVAPPGLRELAALRKLMQKRSPDPKAVAVRAKRAVAELDAWLAALQTAQDKGQMPPLALAAPRRFAHALAANALSADRAMLADYDWDANSAHYLGAAAMYHASGGRANEPKWSGPIFGLANELDFPKRKSGERFDSPAGFGDAKRARVRDSFRELFDATSGR
ncbi:Uncharacterized protein OS=Singulisphaera acidiphila (strain ATCC BAA-1392 / DSM 18658 / VKM B-2454 / MOB10) GN=Sinac_4966 PE=4 SV=1: Cytochrome_C554 [Gemmataceae bacterium]|nr:Uncharacterized protein OS=Singulisphaera acidiphila (strain ATCC BAA-1392 / DSM 18658 / VKM B-2454 / MOB10) GN=Sinac_4966 PE=4 SV=1: Cytochrome_C554 [Gemmataceae bacterium]VTT96711.1 Uncharacterized protein OS=Singulisphaera acidiphila (strain ATCC BAA-1392 / DSM 18658 / VKM B-2454 / MOB10) GN=Sinac_4966 PE=4 SV=1: Cytochrome_C554 [Gemmataceae bacterium]